MTTLNFASCAMALADSLDLVGIDSRYHGKRVGFMASEIVRHLGREDLKEQALLSGLIHDIGVSSSQEHLKLVGLDGFNNAEQHCINGEMLLQRYTPFEASIPIIRYHHTPWHALLQIDLTKDQRLLTNAIFLADRIDVLDIPRGHLPSGEHIHHRLDQMLSEHSTLFAPELKAAAIRAVQQPSFWLTQADDTLVFSLKQRLDAIKRPDITGKEVLQFAHLLARIVDSKSPFTFDHSVGVARVVNVIASHLGLEYQDMRDLHLAALLHDIGKLGIPDDVLNKAGELTKDELLILKAHSFYTFDILRRIQGFEHIADLAGLHHEKLNGTGYPFQSKEVDLSLSQRILAVADIFQALAQTRPYREAMKLEKILQVLDRMVADGELDQTIVQLVHQFSQELHQAALAGDDILFEQMVMTKPAYRSPNTY